MASQHVIEINSQNFQEKVLQSQGTVLVDFWAEWCGPCRQIAPLLDQIADANVGKVTIGKVNVDTSPDLAAQFHIQSIPTLMIFEKGARKDMVVGMTSRKDLEARLGLS